MKKLAIGLISLSLLTAPLFATTSQVTAASQPAATQLNNSTQLTQDKNQVAKIDPYVSVQDNRYVLNIPADKSLSAAEITMAQEMIKKSNAAIEQTHVTISPKTKTAVYTMPSAPDDHGIELRSAGTNRAVFHWNYVRIYLDAGNTRLIAAGAVGAIGGVLAGLATTVGASAFVGAAAAVLGMKASEIYDGTYWDWNYAVGLTNWGWQ